MSLLAKRRLGVIAVWLLLFAEHMLFGATDDRIALLAAIVHCSLCLCLLWTIPHKGRFKRFLWPGFLFIAAMLAAMASTLPVPATLANDAWKLVAPIQGAISLDPLATRLGIMRFIGYAALTLAGALLADDDLHPVIIGTPMLLGAVYAIWAIAAYRINPALILGVVRSPLGQRLSGSFLSPNTAGTLFAVLCAMAALRLNALRPQLGELRRLTQFAAGEILLLGCALGPILVALILTASRGAILALFLSLALLAVIATLRLIAKGKRVLPAAGMVLALLLLAYLIPLMVTRWSLLADSWNERRVAFAAFGHLIQNSPWLGYGIGTFEWQVNLAMTAQNAVALSWIGAVHNFYVQLIAEQGLVGGGMLLISLALTLGHIGSATVRRRSAPSLLIPLSGALLVFAIHGISDYALQIPSMAAMAAFIMGLAYGGAAPAGRGRPSQPE